MKKHRNNSVILAPWRVKRAVGFIELNLATSLRLADIAHAAGLSPMHFAAGFRSATGFSPHAYLQERRIERAKAKLISDGLSIDEIAAATDVPAGTVKSRLHHAIAAMREDSRVRRYFSAEIG